MKRFLLFFALFSAINSKAEDSANQVWGATYSGKFFGQFQTYDDITLLAKASDSTLFEAFNEAVTENGAKATNLPQPEVPPALPNEGEITKQVESFGQPILKAFPIKVTETESTFVCPRIWVCWSACQIGFLVLDQKIIMCLQMASCINVQ